MANPNRPRRRPPQRRTTTPRPAAPAAPQRTFLTPNASPFRRAVERRSALVVVWLHGLPRSMPGLAVLAIIAGGIALPGVAGAACLVFAALIVGWFAYLSWPATQPVGRLIRTGASGGLLALAVARLLA